MSYHLSLLFEQIAALLNEDPSLGLTELSRRLHVSQQTIKKSIRSSAGKTFRNLRNDILIIRVKTCFSSQPEIAIKEISFDFGFKSASSFSRAIKRMSGLSPEGLRSLIANNTSSISTAPSEEIVSRAAVEDKDVRYHEMGESAQLLSDSAHR